MADLSDNVESLHLQRLELHQDAAGARQAEAALGLPPIEPPAPGAQPRPVAASSGAAPAASTPAPLSQPLTKEPYEPK